MWKHRLRHLRRQAGFTLLEIMIALALLSLGMMVLLDSQGGSVLMTMYAKNVTVATQLARAKMAELEQQIEDKNLRFGLSTSVCKDGDFSKDDQSFGKFKWKYCIKKVEVATPDKLPGMGQANDKEGKEKQANSFMGALGLPTSGVSSGANLASSLGPLLGGLQGQLKNVFKQLQESMREIQVVISWKQGSQTYKVSVATHIFNFNKQTGLPGGWPAQAPQSNQ